MSGSDNENDDRSSSAVDGGGGGTCSSSSAATDEIGSTTNNNSNNGGGGIFTKISKLRPFQFLLKKAFQVCDKNNSGKINKDEFYVGWVFFFR